MRAGGVWWCWRAWINSRRGQLSCPCVHRRRLRAALDVRLRQQQRRRSIESSTPPVPWDALNRSRPVRGPSVVRPLPARWASRRSIEYENPHHHLIVIANIQRRAERTHALALRLGRPSIPAQGLPSIHRTILHHDRPDHQPWGPLDAWNRPDRNDEPSSRRRRRGPLDGGVGGHRRGACDRVSRMTWFENNLRCG